MANIGRLAGAESAISKRMAEMEARLTMEMTKRANRLGLAFRPQNAVGVAERMAAVRRELERVAQSETPEDAAEALAAFDTLKPGAGWPSPRGAEILNRLMEVLWKEEAEREAGRGRNG